MRTQLTASEKKRMLKVKNILTNMYDGHLTRYNVSPFDVMQITNCYNELCNAKTTMTLYENVKEFFETKGFIIENYSSGWKIYLSR